VFTTITPFRPTDCAPTAVQPLRHLSSASGYPASRRAFGRRSRRIHCSTGKQTAPHPRPSRCLFFPSASGYRASRRAFELFQRRRPHIGAAEKQPACALDFTVCPILGVSSTHLTFPRRVLCGQRHRKPLAPRAACPPIRKARSLSTRARQSEFVPLYEPRDPHRA
jgi:hypothetical protein